MLINLKGKTFGQWHVLERGQRKSHWLCQCDCGEKYEVKGTHLQKGTSTKCLPCRYKAQIKTYPISEPTDADKKRWHAYRRTTRGKYSVLKRKCKYHNILFDLGFDEYEALIYGNKCEYCGDPLAEAGIGLDRRDRALGYVLGNVVPACAPCNAQKGYLEGAGFNSDRVSELMQELKSAGIKISLDRKPRPWRRAVVAS